MDDKNNHLFPDLGDLEAAYNDSLRKLDLIGTGSLPKDEPPQENHPIDAADYKDPAEKQDKKAVNKMMTELERRRNRKSIWSDTPVIPVKKSIWLDDDKTEPAEEIRKETKKEEIKAAKEDTPPKQPEAPKPAPKPKAPGRENLETIEIKISPEMQEKMRAAKEAEKARAAQLEQERRRAELARAEAAKAAAEERARAEAQAKAEEKARQAAKAKAAAEEKARAQREEAAKRKAKKAAAKQAAAAAVTVKAAADAVAVTAEMPVQQKPRSRQRPEGERSSRTRQRPEGEQSTRTRQRPEGEQSTRTRQRPEEEQSTRTRQRPEGEQTSRTRTRTPAEQPAKSAARARASKKQQPKIKEYETEFSFINAVLCILLIFGTGFALLVMKRESGVIESEKRYYAEMPELTAKTYFNGEYTDGVVTYYTDTIPNREKLKSFSNWFSNRLGIHKDNVQIHGNVKAVEQEKLDEKQKATTTSVTLYTGTTTTTEPPQTEPGETTTTETTTKATTTTKKKQVVADEGEWAENVVIAGKGKDIRAMPAFYGMFSIGKDYADVINEYKEELGDTVNVFNMSIPLSSAFYMPANMIDQFSDQHECIENVGINLKGVINVDVYNALEEHIDEYIYSRTDHHWQPLGAYYAAQVFANAAAVPFADISTYEEWHIDDFLGTMYTYSGYVQELADNPDTFYYYKPDNNYTVRYYDESFSNGYEDSLFFDYASGGNCYSAILGRDDVIAEVTTDCDNDRVLVIMKDSYGNALVPFLTHSFSKIYVLDFRYLNISAVEFMENVGATDVLFSISISGGHTPSHIDSLEEDM